MSSPISHLIAFWECDMHAELVLDWKCGAKRKRFMRDNRAVASYPLLASILLLSNAFKLELQSNAGNRLHLLLANYQHDYLAMLDAITGSKAKQGDSIWGDRRIASELSRGQKCVSPVTQMDLACAWPVNNHSTLHKLLQASAVDPRGKPASSALSPGNEHSVLVEQREQRATGLGRILKYHHSTHASSEA